MIHLRKANDRGLADHGWLKSRHTFSFSEYYDPKHMGFGVLRVIKEDRIAGGTGFGTLSHKDMEIISYVIEGELEHKDSMGNVALIKPGDVQRLSAGTGIQHSEHNHIKDRTTHFLQIWLEPEQLGIKPGYGQKSFAADFTGGGLTLVASKSGYDGSVSLNQDANIYVCKSPAQGAKTLATSRQRRVWVQVINSVVRVDCQALLAGDGAGLEAIDHLELKWDGGAEFIVFDLP